MTSGQYSRLETLLSQADEITGEQALLTPQAKKLQTDIRALLALVTAEKFRAERREMEPPRH